MLVRCLGKYRLAFQEKSVRQSSELYTLWLYGPFLGVRPQGPQLIVQPRLYVVNKEGKRFSNQCPSLGGGRLFLTQRWSPCLGQVSTFFFHLSYCNQASQRLQCCSDKGREALKSELLQWLACQLGEGRKGHKFFIYLFFLLRVGFWI